MKEGLSTHVILGKNGKKVLDFTLVFAFLVSTFGCRTSKFESETTKSERISSQIHRTDSVLGSQMRMIQERTSIRIIEYSLPDEEGKQYIVKRTDIDTGVTDSCSTITKTSSIINDSTNVEQSSTHVEKSEYKANKHYSWRYYSLLLIIFSTIALYIFARLRNISISGLVKRVIKALIH